MRLKLVCGSNLRVLPTSLFAPVLAQAIASGVTSGREHRGSGCASTTRKHRVPLGFTFMRHLAWGENLVETSLLCEQVWAGYNKGYGEKPTFTSHHVLLRLLLHLHCLCHFTSHTGKLKKTYASSHSEKKSFVALRKHLCNINPLNSAFCYYFCYG